MASRKASEGEREEFQPRVNIPAQEEEADIIAEVGAEEDEESGELVADEDKVRKIGAADPATVREDRRLRSIANKKRQGKKNVGFGTNDPLVVYETILKTWEPDSIDITVKRLTGAQIVKVIRSRPLSRTELYNVFENVHGEHEEAEYDIRFHDSSGHQWRGQGRITMPDTRTRGQQTGNGHYPQQGQQPTAPAQPMQPASPFALLQEALDTVQRLQGMQPAQSTPQQTTPSASALLQEALDTVQRLQGMQPSQAAPQSNELSRLVEALQRATGRGVPQPQMHAPQGPQLPTTPAPPGYKYTWLPESNCCVLEPINNRPSQVMRGPEQRGPRPYYPQQGEQQERYDRYDPSQQHRGPPDPIRESMGNIRRAMALREELDSLFGGGGLTAQHGGHLDGTSEQDPDSPVIIERTEDGELVRNREDGSIRGWDTLLVNMPRMIKKGGEFIDKISKTAVAERERRERAEQQRLPPGFVRLTEGYEPPEGLVAVPVDRAPPQAPPRQDLPPPPAHVPPPIREVTEPPPPPPPRGWDEDL